MALTLEEIEKQLFDLGGKIKEVLEFQKNADWPANKKLADDAKAELEGKLTKLQERYDALHAEYLKLKTADEPKEKHTCYWCR